MPGVIVHEGFGMITGRHKHGEPCREAECGRAFFAANFADFPAVDARCGAQKQAPSHVDARTFRLLES